MDRFHQPTTLLYLTNEAWRLYSQTAEVGSEAAEVMVGVLEKAPWRLAEASATAQLDHRLVEEVKRIAARVTLQAGRLSAPRIRSNVDEFAVVDRSTGRVLRWSGELPARLPPDASLRVPKLFHLEGSDLYLVRSDRNEDLMAVSLGLVVNLWWFLLVLLLSFSLAFVLAYVAFSTRLKKLVGRIARGAVDLNEALRTGENQYVEFKREPGDYGSLLRAVTAFANTNDGTIFVGVTDDGHAVGVNAATLQERDHLSQAILNSTGSRIQPTPTVHIDYPQLDGRVVARLFVPRGNDPLYFLDKVIYVRRGVQTIGVQPTDIRRILEEFIL